MPFLRSQSLRTIEFPFPPPNAIEPHEVSIPLVDRYSGGTGEGNRNSCYGGKSREPFLPVFPTAFVVFRSKPRESKSAFLKRIWKQYFPIAKSSSLPSPPRAFGHSFMTIQNREREKAGRRAQERARRGDGCKIKFCANK